MSLKMRFAKWRVAKMSMAASAVAGLALLTGLAAPAAAETITIGTSPTLSGLDVFYAIDKGYFKDAGLDVKTEIMTSGAQAVPLLLNNTIQLGLIDTAITISARSRDIPLIITAPSIVGAPDKARGYADLMVPADSPIHSLKDTAGKTFAVSQINGTIWAIVRATLDKNGVDSNGVKFVEVPFPQIWPTLQQKRADIGFIPEPLASIAMGEGARIIYNPEADTVAGVPVLPYTSIESWAKANVDTLKKINDVLIRVHKEFNDHHDVAIEAAKKFTKTPPDMLPKMTFPVYDENKINPAKLQIFVDLAVKYGLVANPDKAPKATDLVLPGL
jgi:NitT/TauT family transport system substrate-binding protein